MLGAYDMNGGGRGVVWSKNLKGNITVETWV
jgi:hypothetical protein